MPFESPAQARLMRAVAHGWEKPGGGGPSQSVAREFVNADQGMYTGGLAAMNLHEGGDVYDPYYGRDPNAKPISKAHQKLLDWKPGDKRGLYGNMIEKLQRKLRAKYGIDAQGFPTAPPPTAYQPPTGPRGRGGRRGGRGGRRVPPGPIDQGGVPVPGNEPPVIPPYVAPPPRDRRHGRDTQYSQQLSAHKERIANILRGNARGGYMNYQEGGEVRAGHAEGKNPYPVSSARYKLWERKHHRDPAPPPVAKAEDEEGGLLSGIFGRSRRELEELEEARGGYVGYQYGGLAQAAGRGRPPMRGGMPPPVRGGMRPGMMKPQMRPGMDPRRSGPKLQPPPIDGGAGIPGGPMVPPNLRGHLQKMRMQNRPTPNVGHGVNRVGDGGNRVGQQDQQGGLARALQRGTGRPPMSRRSGFPGR